MLSRDAVIFWLNSLTTFNILLNSIVYACVVRLRLSESHKTRNKACSRTRHKRRGSEETTVRVKQKDSTGDCNDME